MEFPLYLEEPHQYQLLGADSRRLRTTGLSWVAIARVLGLSDKTAKKAAMYFDGFRRNSTIF